MRSSCARTAAFSRSTSVAARQHPGQLRILLLGCLHRLVDGLADIGPFRQIQQMGKARRLRQIHHSLGMVGRGIVGARSGTAGRCPDGFQLGATQGETGFGKQQENQTQHRGGILRRCQPGIGAELIGRSPQAFLNGVGDGISFGWCDPLHAFSLILLFGNPNMKEWQYLYAARHRSSDHTYLQAALSPFQASCAARNVRCSLASYTGAAHTFKLASKRVQRAALNPHRP